MSVFRTFWTCKSYLVRGEAWYWLSAVLEMNMLNAMERVACCSVKELKLEEHSEKEWTATQWAEKPEEMIMYKVWMSEEMPIVVDKEHTIISDHRPKDRFWINKEHSVPPRPGFKEMPMEFRF